MAIAKGSDHIITRSNTNELSHVVATLTTSVMKKHRVRPYAADVALCATKNWLFMNSEQGLTVTTAPLKIYQGIGNGVEDVITEGFDTHGDLLSTQIKLPNPPKTYKIDVGGYIDMLAFDRLGRVAAYEIKTCGTLPDKPKENHLAQAMAYACLGGLDIVYIVYVSRSVQNFPDPTPLLRVFELKVQDLLLEYMTTIVLSCHSLHNEKAPLRPMHFHKSNECSYCPFIQACWKEDGFEFQNAGEYSISFSAAEKIAMELIEQRKSFFSATLSNAIGSASDTNKPKVIALKGMTPERCFAGKAN